MKVYFFNSYEEFVQTGKGIHLAMGMFDGVHLGHQSVIESAIRSAKRTQGISGILTFWPHPSKILRPEKATSLILSLKSKQMLLKKTGINFIIQQQFTIDFSQKTGESFLEELKKCIPLLSAIYVGENFRFGHNRTGDISTLLHKGKELGVDVFNSKSISCNNNPISSSLIRQLIQEGNILRANEMLGYTYFAAEFSLIHRNESYIFLKWDPECRLAYGKYVVQINKSHKNILTIAYYYFSKEYAVPLLQIDVSQTLLLSQLKDMRIEFLEKIV